MGMKCFVRYVRLYMYVCRYLLEKRGLAMEERWVVFVLKGRNGSGSFPLVRFERTTKDGLVVGVMRFFRITNVYSLKNDPLWGSWSSSMVHWLFIFCFFSPLVA